jgi:hypothetical protein
MDEYRTLPKFILAPGCDVLGYYKRSESRLAQLLVHIRDEEAGLDFTRHCRIDLDKRVLIDVVPDMPLVHPSEIERLATVIVDHERNLLLRTGLAPGISAVALARNLHAELEGAIDERDAAMAERDAMMAARDAAIKALDDMRTQRDDAEARRKMHYARAEDAHNMRTASDRVLHDVQAKLKHVTQERDDYRAAHRALNATHGTLCDTATRLVEERDEAVRTRGEAVLMGRKALDALARLQDVVDEWKALAKESKELAEKFKGLAEAALRKQGS